MLKLLIKKQLPTFEKDLNVLIETILVNVADKTEQNPYELKLTLSKGAAQARGRVYCSNNEVLQEFDAGLLIEDLFKAQLSVMPKMAQDLIQNEMSGENIQKMVQNTLDGFILMASYENYELIYKKVDKKGVEIIQLSEIVHKFI